MLLHHPEIVCQNRSIPKDQPALSKRPATNLATSSEVLPAAPNRLPDFVKVEKNLASLGFFTPSSKRIRKATSKRITFHRVVDGQRMTVAATIVPGAIYGLPITADQDKYLALQKIIGDLRRDNGRVANPVAFSSAQLLALLRKCRDSGKNYQEVSEWLDVMSATTIVSEGVVYLAGRKRWVKDRFRVFDRAVSAGQEIEPGRVADRNFVWLSEWQLENINNNYLLPVDFEAYRQLRNHIAKALVPLLQIWLYASREKGSFDKRYDELCQILNIGQFKAPSRIRQQLGPSLEELVAHGYLARWDLPKTADGSAYKVVFFHGPKFHRDRRQRLEAAEAAELLLEEPDAEAAAVPPSAIVPDQSLLGELTRRGVLEGVARRLLRRIPPGQPIQDQLEWGDYVINQEPAKFRNPAGFYVSLLRENVEVPESFVTSHRRREEDQRLENERRALDQKAEQELAYRDYQQDAVEAHIRTLKPAEYERRVAEKKAAVVERHPQAAQWTPTHLAAYADVQVRADLSRELSLMTFDQFARGKDGNAAS
jgi:hypothetical protein